MDLFADPPVPMSVAAELEAAGFRLKVVNGSEVWSLRGFDFVGNWMEAVGYGLREFASQRAAALIAPWHKRPEGLLDAGTFLAASGTALMTEFGGSQNHALAGAAIIASVACRIFDKVITERARRLAAAEIHKTEITPGGGIPKLPPMADTPPEGNRRALPRHKDTKP